MRIREYALVAAIFATSLLLWIAAPLGALWVTSQLTDDAFAIVFGGAAFVLPVLMAVFGLLLARLNGAYLRAVAVGSERFPERRPKNVLEVSLTLSVMVAAAGLVVFFLFFAHNANPGNPGL
jgi:uncharacterized membrane protein YbhN (UPF0104 family)